MRLPLLAVLRLRLIAFEAATTTATTAAAAASAILTVGIALFIGARLTVRGNLGRLVFVALIGVGDSVDLIEVRRRRREIDDRLWTEAWRR